MPLDGWDHVELWVGNAKQAAYFYEHAFGFRRTAYAGPETGVRDRASYVLEQGEIRLVVTSGLRARLDDLRASPALHGDGVKDIALRVPDATNAYRAGGAARRARRQRAALGRGRVRHGRARRRSRPTATSIHTFVNRAELRGRVPARATSRRSRRTAATRASACMHDRPRRRQRRARPDEPLGRVLRARRSG